MTTNEKEALLQYLEWQLNLLAKNVERNIDPTSAHIVYSYIYEILNDIDHSIDSNMLIEAANHKPKPDE